MRYVVVALCFCFGSGFILEDVTPSPDEMTESHFIMVMKLLLEEKQQRQHLEAVVTKMHADFLNLQQKYFNIQQDHNTVLEEVISLKNETAFLRERNMQIEQKYSKVENEINQLAQELVHANNSVERQKEEFNISEQMQPINQIYDIRTLRTEMTSLLQHQQLIQNDINVLTRNQQARKDDFMALFNLTLSIKASQELQVAITSCAGGEDRKYSIGDILQFPYIKTNVRVTDTSFNTSTGVFTCEYPGLYFVAETVLSATYNAAFETHKNSEILNYGFVSKVHDQTTKWSEHTGTSIVATELKLGNQISIKAVTEFVMGSYNSCITIIKIQ